MYLKKLSVFFVKLFLKKQKWQITPTENSSWVTYRFYCVAFDNNIKIRLFGIGRTKRVVYYSHVYEKRLFYK